ncbi:carbohydrate sulfotransferase 11-like [Branchiostoma floridae x Branchiostoma belcheri]
MVKMGFFWPTRKFLFLSILILSTGAVYLYMYVSNNGVELAPEEIVIGAVAREKGPSTTSPSWSTSTLPANSLQNSLSDSDNIPHFNLTSTSSPCTSQSLVQDNWDSLAEAEKEQARRLATFKTYCERNPSTVDPSQTQVKSHVMLFENIQTAYCYIPKTGCTTMKTLFYNVEHNTTVRSVDISDVELLAFRFKKLKHYSEEEARLRLATYRKIIVVRDPLERLASAWMDKFVYQPKHRNFWGFVNGLNHRLRTYRERNLPDKSKQGTFNDKKAVSFRDFLFGVSKRLDDNEHWLSFNRLCLPCQINYDFIAHTDTIASDVRLFLKKNNITANEDILPEQRQRHVNDDNVFGDIYGQVPIEDILPLRHIFQEDFDMFGYSFEQDLAEILKGKTKAKG